MKRSFQRDLMLLFAGCSVVPLVIVAWSAHYSSTAAITSMVQRQTSFSCRQIDERFQRQLRRVQDQFLLIALGGGAIPSGWEGRSRRREGQVEFYHADLRSGAGLGPAFTGLVFVDDAGRTRIKIDYAAPAVRNPDGIDEFFTQFADFAAEDGRGFAEAGPLASGELVTLTPDPASGTMSLRLVTPLSAEDGSRGALLGDVDAFSLVETIVDGMSLGIDAFHFVVDARSRIVVAHPDFAKRNQLLDVALPPLSETELTAREVGWERFQDEERQDWIVSYRRLGASPWVVAVASPLAIYLAPIRRAGLLSVALVVLVLSLITLVIVLATRHYRRSLGALSGAAQAFSDGRLDERIDVRSEDELGALATTFNRMADDLQRQITRREESARLESFSRLSAAVAHDLKSSLFSLSLLVENLDRHIGDPEFIKDASGTIRASLVKIRKIGERLTQRQPQAEWRPRHLELADFLDGLLRGAGVDERHGIRVVTRLAPHLVVQADPAELERLFLNLINNALEAMPDGGTLTVGCARDDQAAGGVGRAAVIVEDTGVGMSPDFVRDQLFRAFCSTKSGGIGLGLFSVKEIVDRHRGAIRVDSTPEVGTRITVHLPFAMSEREAIG